MKKNHSRRNLLRSRASILAIVAMTAAAPAQAAGPFVVNSPSCRISTFGDFVFADPNGRSVHVTETGSVKSNAGSTLDFIFSSFSGSILNQGLVAFGAAYPSSCSGAPAFSGLDAAVSLQHSAVPEGILNDTTGQILSERDGFYIFNTLIGPEGGEAADQTFKNLGLIETQGIAVGMLSSSVVGTLFNGGTIRSTNGQAVSISGSFFASEGGEGGEGCVECELGFGPQAFLPTISGSFVNEGLIKSDLFNAVLLSDVFIENKLLNAESGEIEGGPQGAGITVIGDTTINQGIENRGLISGGRGIRFLFGGTYTGGLANFGTIQGDQNGVEIGIANYYGGFSNNSSGQPGEGVVDGGAGFGVFAGGSEGQSIARFEGGFTNGSDARISGESGAVLMMASALNTDFENFGTMAIDPYSGSGSGAGNFSVFRFDTNYYSGDFTNTGLIDGRARSATNGAILQAGTIEGDVTTTGQIFSSDSPDTLGLALITNNLLGDLKTGGTVKGDTALYVNNYLPGGDGAVEGAFINGDFVNSGHLDGTTTGAFFEFTSWIGDFTNTIDGEITGGVTGAVLAGNLMSGSYINNGLIEGGGFTTGQHFEVDTFDGSITNGVTGVIKAASLALHLEINELSGDVLNNGLIEATDPAGVAALLKSNGGSGSYAGKVINNGTIRGGTSSGSGLRITTFVEDGVVNKGTLKGKTAYDTRDAAGPTTFLQQGANALVEGDMLLSLNDADDVTFEGGSLRGSIFGAGEDDDVTVDVGGIAPAAVGPLAIGSFAFNGNQVSGIGAFTAQSGVSLMGTLSDDADGLGMSMTSESVTVKSGAELFLDDNTLISTKGLDIEDGATLTYFLTQDVNQHGVIEVNAPVALSNGFAALALPGQANLAGTLQIRLNDYEAFRTSGRSSFVYTGLIQASGGINGQFGASAFVGNEILGFQYVLETIQNPNSIDLRIFRTAFDELIEDPSQNQEAVGEALNDVCLTAPSNSPLADFCDFVGFLPEGEIPDAFDQISGFQIPQISGLGLDLTELLTLPSNENNVHGTAFGTCQQAGFGWCGTQQYAALGTTANDAMPEEDAFAWLRPGKRQVGKTGVWGRYVGNWRNVEGDANARGLRAQTHGFAAGADHVVSEDLMIGVAGLFADTTSTFARSPADEGDVKTYQAGAYASWGDADFYVNLNSTAIWNEFETRRRVQTGPATFAFADGDFNGFGGTAFLEMGTVIEADGLRLQPLASVFYMTHTTDEFTETGAPTLNLIVRESTTQSLRTSLGARLSHPFKWGDTRIVPELRAGWRHEFLDVRQDSNVAFAHDPSIQMHIVGSQHARDMAVFGMGVSASLDRNTVLYGDMDGAFNADKNSVQVSFGLRHSW